MSRIEGRKATVPPPSGHALQEKLLSKPSSVVWPITEECLDTSSQSFRSQCIDPLSQTRNLARCRIFVDDTLPGSLVDDRYRFLQTLKHYIARAAGNGFFKASNGRLHACFARFIAQTSFFALFGPFQGRLVICQLITSRDPSKLRIERNKKSRRQILR